MTIKQLSIFIENKSGTLIKVLDLLSKSGIQIIASTIADTKDYGIYRILCNHPTQAYLMLKEEGINVQLTDVHAVYVKDKVGEAANTIRLLSKGEISIAYMYSFLLHGKGVLVFRCNPTEKAEEILTINKITFLTEIELK